MKFKMIKTLGIIKFVLLALINPISITYADFILSSPLVTNFGTWNALAGCPDDEFVHAIDVQFSPGPLNPPPIPDGPDGKDDQGITGIATRCSNPYAPLNEQCEPLDEADTTCDGYAIGFQLKSADPEIALDNFGATNIRLYCSGLRNSPTGYVEGAPLGEFAGTWTEPQFCKERQAICGIRLQIHAGGTDVSGINNVRFKCCDLPSPVAQCDPVEAWELVQECDNLLGKNPIPCSFQRYVGVGVQTALASEGHKALYRNRDLGFDVTDKNNPPYWLYDELSTKFSVKFGSSNITGYDWAAPHYEAWNPMTPSDFNKDVKEGYRSLIFQLVGTCSYVTVRTGIFRKIDVDKFNLCRGLECLSSQLSEKIF